MTEVGPAVRRADLARAGRVQRSEIRLVPLILYIDPPLGREYGPIASVPSRHNTLKHVHATLDGLDALDMFRAHIDDVALALLDVVMPRLGGQETYNEIRKLKPDTPVLFTTGYSADAVHERLVLEEGMHLLQKPCSMPTLLRAVRDLLDETFGSGANKVSRHGNGEHD